MFHQFFDIWGRGVTFDIKKVAIFYKRCPKTAYKYINIATKLMLLYLLL